MHGHFFVNGIKVTSPSYQCRPGDVITIRPKEPIFDLYKSVVGDGNSQQTPDWITFDTESLRATVAGVPGPGKLQPARRCKYRRRVPGSIRRGRSNLR